jgi:cytoskeleton protein RodZ
MSSAGDYLRGLREQRGLSLDEIARVTRVASRYLEALETNRFSALPAPVFTRGFIRAYCQALGEPPDEALARYDGREGTPPAKTTPITPSPPRTKETEGRSPSAVVVSLVLLVVLGMALVAVALMTQPARDERRAAPLTPVEPLRPTPPVPTPPVGPPMTAPPVATSSTTAPAIAGPSAPMTAAAPASAPSPAGDRGAAPTPPVSQPSQIASVPASAPLSSAPVTPDVARQTPPPTPLPDIQAATNGVSSPYRLVARVSEPTWIRVRMEDGGSTEETVPAGAVREWVSNRPFVLTVGNAGGVVFELNGRPLPPLGARGAVISRLVLPPQ